MILIYLFIEHQNIMFLHCKHAKNKIVALIFKKAKVCSIFNNVYPRSGQFPASATCFHLILIYLSTINRLFNLPLCSPTVRQLSGDDVNLLSIGTTQGGGQDNGVGWQYNYGNPAAFIFLFTKLQFISSSRLSVEFCPELDDLSLGE